MALSEGHCEGDESMRVIVRELVATALKWMVRIAVTKCVVTYRFTSGGKVGKHILCAKCNNVVLLQRQLVVPSQGDTDFLDENVRRNRFHKS